MKRNIFNLIKAITILAGVFLPVLTFEVEGLEPNTTKTVYDSVFFLLSDNYKNAIVFWPCFSYIVGSVIYVLTCFSSSKTGIIISGITLLGLSVGGCYFLFTHIGLGTIYAFVYLLNIILYFFNIGPSLAKRKSVIHHQKVPKDK